MNSSEFEKLINTEKYQIFVFTCIATFPFLFARHSYFVVNRKGMISRWDVFFRKNLCETAWNYLHMNFLSPTQGISIFPFWEKMHWKSALLISIEGDENSVILKAVNFIENSKNIYPYCDEYHITGPNSNTYVQWVLDSFPELKIKLPEDFLAYIKEIKLRECIKTFKLAKPYNTLT